MGVAERMICLVKLLLSIRGCSLVAIIHLYLLVNFKICPHLTPFCPLSCISRPNSGEQCVYMYKHNYRLQIQHL